MFQNSLMLLFPGVHCRIWPRNGASLWVWSLRKPSEFEHKAFKGISFSFSFLLIVLTLLLFRASQMGCSLTWWGKSTGIWDAWNVWKDRNVVLDFLPWSALVRSESSAINSKSQTEVCRAPPPWQPPRLPRPESRRAFEAGKAACGEPRESERHHQDKEKWWGGLS